MPVISKISPDWYLNPTFPVHVIAARLAALPRFRDLPQSFPHYSIAQHAVMVSMHQENVGAALSVQLWGLHHEDAYAFNPLNDTYRRWIQGLIAVEIPLQPTWPPPASLFMHNLVTTVTEALTLHLDLDPACFNGIPSDEHLIICPLPADRAANLYIARHNELLAAMEAAKKP